MTKPCSHELHEMETASAWDGLCPICLKEKVDRLEKKITRLESKRKYNPLTAEQFLLKVMERM